MISCTIKIALLTPTCTLHVYFPITVFKTGAQVFNGDNFVHYLCQTGFVILVLIFTTGKASLGQGNIVTSICHSVHGVSLTETPWTETPLDIDPLIRDPSGQRPPEWRPP